MLIIGSHVGFKGDQLLGSLKEALSYGANTFMFYTGAPQNTRRSSIDFNLTREALELMKINNIDINNVICHAPYIVNPASNDSDKHQFAINFIKNELDRCSELNVKYMVLHPGSAVGETREEAINNIVDVLNSVLDESINVSILLETMAGKGNEMGITTQELKSIIDNVNVKSRIGVCVDTCHINDAGYDLKEFDKYLDEFDSLIGIEKIKCIHVNDSKNPINSHKDRHANIGYGTIGFDTLINVIYNSRLENVVKILETPYTGEDENDDSRIYPPYKFEIDMIRSKEFNNNLYDDIKNCYK
jgi:deoxyribonuclease-4